MSPLERYNELTKDHDQCQRDELNGKARSESVDDERRDVMDTLWGKMTDAEREEARKYSAHLHEQWTPKENYLDALDCLHSIPQPGPNNATAPESRSATKSYWVKCRDEALKKMQPDGTVETMEVQVKVTIKFHNATPGLGHILDGIRTAVDEFLELEVEYPEAVQGTISPIRVELVDAKYGKPTQVETV